MEEISEQKVNKRIGGTDRAKIARDDLEVIFTDSTHPEHMEKDIYFARKYDVTRHTIYKIREDFKIPSRSKRVLAVLKSIDTGKYTLHELSKTLDLKYQNLYKTMVDNNLPYKKD